MYNYWKFRISEFSFLLNILHLEDVPVFRGLPEEVSEQEQLVIAACWQQHGLVVEDAEAWQLEEATALVLAAFAEAQITLSFTCGDREAFLFIHGATIGWMTKDDDVVELFWLPILPLAIGALDQWIRRHQVYTGKVAVEGAFSMDPETEDKDKLSEVLMQNDEETMQRILRWLAFSNSKVLGEVLKNESV